MLRLDASKRVEDFLRRLPTKHARQIAAKLFAPQSDPFPPDSKSLSGQPYRRADVGEYRIVYAVEGDRLRVPLIGKRNDAEVYKQLARLT